MFFCPLSVLEMAGTAMLVLKLPSQGGAVQLKLFLSPLSDIKLFFQWEPQYHTLKKLLIK